jgi:hypothetical protein
MEPFLLLPSPSLRPTLHFMSKTLPYELREMIFTKLLFHDSECEMPDLIIALRGWRTEHELCLELVEIFYGEMVFHLNKDNIWKLRKLSNKATRWVERLEIVWCEPK